MTSATAQLPVSSQAPTTIQIALRRGTEAELPWLFSSWLRSHRHSALAAPIPNNDYYRQHHELIERLLARPAVSFMVATTPDDTDTALGWIVRESGVVHYVLVKEGFRHHYGLFEVLMGDLLNRESHPKGVRFTHYTKDIHMRVRRWTEDEAILTGQCPSSPHRLDVSRLRDAQPGSPNSAAPDRPQYKWKCRSPGCHYSIVRDTNRDPPRPPLAIYDPYEAFR